MKSKSSFRFKTSKSCTPLSSLNTFVLAVFSVSPKKQKNMNYFETSSFSHLLEIMFTTEEMFHELVFIEYYVTELKLLK